MSTLDSQASGAFAEPEDGFADDDLLAPDDISSKLSNILSRFSKCFLSAIFTFRSRLHNIARSSVAFSRDFIFFS